MGYGKREYCKAKKCVVQEWIEDGDQDAKECCKKGCCHSAYEFHNWLQKNGYKIVKP